MVGFWVELIKVIAGGGGGGYEVRRRRCTGFLFFSCFEKGSKKGNAVVEKGDSGLVD